MSLIRLRVTGSRDGLDALMTHLQGVQGVERIEEVADLMPHMDDGDSSSAGLSDDTGGDVYALEVLTETARRDEVSGSADRIAARHGLVLEYVDEF